MKLRKMQIIAYSAALLSLVCFWVLSCISGSLKHDSQMAAERWQGDSEQEYAQVSVYLGSEAGLTTDSVDGIKEMVDAALQNASLKAASADTRLWCGAYSTQLGQIPMSGTKLNGGSGLATAVGGDFFVVHPMTLLDGNYISDADLMQDMVVLDEKLAWQLFGSSEVSGMEVIVNDKRCLVAGVVRPETDQATRTAYGESARFYLSYALYRQLDAENGLNPVINCYEAVLPNPVRGFAEKTIRESVGERDSMRVVQNTGRSSLSRRWYNLRHIHEMLVNPDSAAFPYWENAARITDYDQAMLLGFMLFFLIWPVLCGLHLLWKGYQWLNRFIIRWRKERKNRYRSDIPQV